ncbi:Ribonuclease H-like protein [Glarea lozoyensis ATCC 20868]|uniref:RNA exonuclease 4 n=1 Tax=Glarea lozoyensis (strain ATCC 20868 / MF5171) TaxID=1116229 RepID=S3DYQ5_GLAL2|nr:Ribonuclease H-like protein [Glarea lozoyensis ATCC 20868]EPE37071.1 Ribonuclease H-like protein [Glarea lozoyensis ATCC 20868]
MAPELSSNWKKLQSVLKKENSVKADKKRKAPTEQTRNSIAKRRRLLGDLFEPASTKALGVKRRKMGNGSSSGEAAAQAAPSATLALWAEDNDISARDLADAYGEDFKNTTVPTKREDKVNGGLSEDVEIGKYVGLDCEMVGVGGEQDRSVLARISIVNFHGTQVYDSFVRPKEFVTDWRTHVSGVSPKNMATAREFDDVQQEVAKILKGRVIVGHALKNDLDALMLGHSKRDIRDTSKFPGFKQYSTGKYPKLKTLAKEILGVEIQGGEHSSIEDARAAMLLFRRHKSAFDIDHAQRFPVKVQGSGGGKSNPKKKKKKGKH